MVRELRKIQVLPVSPVQAWEFFSDPRNLPAPEFFVDEQRSGPYRFWHHAHFLRPVEGGREIVDRVHYALPFGPAGGLAAGALVRRELEAICAYRARALQARFGAA